MTPKAPLPKDLVAAVEQPKPPKAGDRSPALVRGGEWRADGGELVQSKPGKGMILLGNPDWTDYDLTFDTRTDSAPGVGKQGGIHLFRAQDASNYHVFTLGPYGGTFDEVHRIENGMWVRDVNPIRRKYELDRWYAVAIRVQGDKIQCSLDGKESFAYTDAHFPKGQIGFATWDSVVRWRNIKVTDPDGKVLWSGPPAVAGANPDPKAGDFTPLFNGKDLTGWKGLPDRWTVRDGTIIGSSNPSGIKFNTCLVADKEYGDFEMKCMVKLTSGAKANSGIQIRSKMSNAAKFIVEGPQCDAGADYWGSLYGEGSGMMQAADPAAVAKALKPDKFNEIHIRCVGNRVTIKLNGVTTVDREFAGLPATGIIGLQLHGGDAQAVEFRNLEIKELPAVKEPPKQAAPEDPFAEKSVWISTGGIRTVLTVTERKAGTFKARFEVGPGIDRELSGTVKDGKVSWLAKDVKAIRGTPGGDNVGTLARDKDGDRIDFTWSAPGFAGGTFVLRRQPGK